MRWSWNGKEIIEEGKHRSKRGAKNEAARSVLKQLAADEVRRLPIGSWAPRGLPMGSLCQAELLDPRQNGALAQWDLWQECRLTRSRDKQW